MRGSRGQQVALSLLGPQDGVLNDRRRAVSTKSILTGVDLGLHQQVLQGHLEAQLGADRSLDRMFIP